MRFSKLDNWDAQFRHDGILYFAQRIQEMLFHYTSHIYKAPILNTFLLAKEYLHTAELVRKKAINGSHLEYIMEEFQETFSNDLIVQKYIDAELKNQVLQGLNSSSSQKQEKIMAYILHLLQDYNEWCKEYLREIVLQEKEKKKIDRALRCYIPGLIEGGYSHEYIYYYSRKVFFKLPVKSTSVLDTFLNRFDFVEKEYDVYVPIEKWAFAFREILESRLNISFDQDEYKLDLKYDTEKYRLVKMHISALDERTAAGVAYDRLDLFFRYYNFVGNYKDNWLFNTGEVIDEYASKSFVNLKPEGFHFSTQAEENEIGKFSEMLITSLLQNAWGSFSVINRAVNIHNLAIAENNLDNGFLNLWSILEILFVSDQDDSKINELQRKVVPILQKDYIQLIFGELVHYLTDNVPPKELSELQSKVGETSSNSMWLYFLVLMPQYKSIRQELYGLLKDYPLIRSRISQLSDTYSKKEHILSDTIRYTQRVKWHLKRLYRTRNAIIHAGETPNNLKELGEHLHSYVDECLFEIVVLLALDGSLHTIDNVVIDVQVKTELMMNLLKSKGQISESDIRFLLKDYIQENKI